ncbi:hypothetical protein ABZW02_25735 [Streptomyces sp. NPDC005180]|uniref:hypothetical protein n=1 Tax=Streptomyces sp. NPDC005180 TaxID=3156868 RepID=UPI0033B803E3
MTEQPPVTGPAPARRLSLLRRTASEWFGEWTTRRVQHLYIAHFGPGDWRRAARSDLAELHRQHLLILHDEDSGRRFYTVNSYGGTQ